MTYPKRRHTKKLATFAYLGQLKLARGSEHTNTRSPYTRDVSVRVRQKPSLTEKGSGRYGRWCRIRYRATCRKLRSVSKGHDAREGDHRGRRILSGNQEKAEIDTPLLLPSLVQ